MSKTKLLRDLAKQIRDSLLTHGVDTGQPLTAAHLLDALETIASITELDDCPACDECGRSTVWDGLWGAEWACPDCQKSIPDMG
jgi:tRNA(Ile2) C34 agmatinyltransferase TiaS